MTRADIRTRVRDYLYEDTADKFSDTKLNRLFEEEVRSLPSKGVFIEEIHEATPTDDQDITLPSNYYGITRVEHNLGTITSADWQSAAGWEDYGGFLRLRTTTSYPTRVFIKKSFTIPSGGSADATELDIPAGKDELVVWGIVIRAYRLFIGYLRSNVSWDSVTKPGDISIPTIQNWLREAQGHYDRLLSQYATRPRAQDIDLVS